ncbi:MAG: hypothetical protein DRH50_02305 [Deltaproteobacteria bacterium]|nr:MAG: hypothetical protein DRH50_02305 [Deltaproteobacteria bacterium]
MLPITRTGYFLFCGLVLLAFLVFSRPGLAGRWGLRVTDQPADLAPGHGARVTAVIPGGPADRAGLKAGDVITHSQGQKVREAEDFVSIVRSLPSGKNLSLTVVREGWKRDIILAPEVRPEMERTSSLAAVKDTSSRTPEEDLCIYGWLGVGVASLPEKKGAVIKTTGRTGFEVGDIIKAVDGVETPDANTFLKILRNTRPAQKVTFMIERHGRPKSVVAIMGKVPEDVCLRKRIYQAMTDGDLPRAKSLAMALLERYPDNASGYSDLGGILIEEGDLDAAKESLKRAIELAPKISAYKSNLGTIYLRENDFKEAERYFRLAVKDDPKDQVVWGNLGDLYRKQNRFSEAIDAYQRALELAPDYPLPYFRLGDIYFEGKKWKEAGKYYEKGLELDPKVQLAWMRVGETYQIRYMYSEAIAAFRKALEVGPPNVEVLLNLAIVLKNQQDYSGAKESCIKAIQIDPENSSVYHNLGTIYFEQKNWKKAKEYFELAVKYDQKIVPAWMQLGDTYSRLYEHSQAISAYQKAIEVASQEHRDFFGARIFYGLGWNLFREKRYAEAENALEKSLKFNPNNPDTMITLGTALAMQKKIAQAQKYWKRAVELDPGGETGQAARQNLSRAGLADALKGISGPVAGRADGLKATVAVGDFQVKAATAGQVIGDGLREMFMTALHNCGYFIVLERIDIKGLAAEQALSRSPMARRGSAIPGGLMDVADIMIYGVVTEFEAEASGSGMMMGMPQVPFSIGASQKEAHMAIDIRVVDVGTGRLLAVQRIPGRAISTQGTFGTTIPVGNFSMPASFSMFRNTPMEQAIRDCVKKATYYVVNNIPEDYFSHK